MFLVKVCVLLAVLQSCYSADFVTLVSFDGNPQTTYHFDVTNDPVMGGLSSSNFTVNTNLQLGLFEGTVRIVPKLQAPGFCEILTPNPFSTRFADVSTFTHLALRVRSKVAYDGFKVSFAADTLNPLFGSFKADFTIAANYEWTDVLVPFLAFSNSWSAATGEPTKTCAANPEVCPTPQNLRDIGQVGLWAEGHAGDFHLEVEWIRGMNATKAILPKTEMDSPSCAGPIADPLRYNCSNRLARDYLPPGMVNDTVSLASAICCGGLLYPEPASFYARPDVNLFSSMQVPTTFYDSVCGIPVFVAPVGRTFAAMQAEMAKYGWPSFRSQEIVAENIYIVNKTAVYSKCGTNLGSFLPDEDGPRYCIDLVCIAGNPHGQPLR